MFVHVCSHLFTFVHVCSRLFTFFQFVHVCSRLFTFIHILTSLIEPAALTHNFNKNSSVTFTFLFKIASLSSNLWYYFWSNPIICPTICQVIAHLRLIEPEEWADLFSRKEQISPKILQSHFASLYSAKQFQCEIALFYQLSW